MKISKFFKHPAFYLMLTVVIVCVTLVVMGRRDETIKNEKIAESIDKGIVCMKGESCSLPYKDGFTHIIYAGINSKNSFSIIQKLHPHGAYNIFYTIDTTMIVVINHSGGKEIPILYNVEMVGNKSITVKYEERQ